MSEQTSMSIYLSNEKTKNICSQFWLRAKAVERQKNK